jgi:DNA-binding Lrp family transcriptional regulator
MRTIFVFIKTRLGSTYDVAADVVDNIAEVVSIHSISGQFDLLLRCDLPDDADIGRFVTDQVQTRANIVDTNTLVAFNAFTRDSGIKR